MAKKVGPSQKAGVIIEDALTEADNGASAIKNHSSFDTDDAIQTLIGDVDKLKKIDDTVSGSDSKKRNTIRKVQKLVQQAEKKPAIKLFKKIKKNVHRLVR